MKPYLIAACALVLSLIAFLVYQTYFPFDGGQGSDSIEVNVDAELRKKP